MSDFRDVSPKTGIVIGTAFLAAGLAIASIALGWIHADPASLHAPRWVLAVCGLIFAAPGVGMLYYAFDNLAGDGERRAGEGEAAGVPLLPRIIALVIAAGMAAVLGWVAFGSREPRSSGEVTIGPFHMGGSSSGSSGHVAFRIESGHASASSSASSGHAVLWVGAVLIAAIVVWVLIRRVRKRAGGGGGVG